MLSIIICTLNEELYLPKLLDSLGAQTYRYDYEVLVVDAGSTDQTEVVVRQYQVSRPFSLRFVAFNQRGIARQRNEGANLAQYEQLLFLDADVVLDEKFLTTAMQQIAKKKLPIAGTKLYAAEPAIGFRAAYCLYSNIYLPIIRWFNPIIHGCSIFVTKKMHQQIGGFKEGILFEDHFYGSEAAKIFRPPLLKGRAYVRTSARRFYNFSPKAIGELVWGSFQSFYKAGIDPATMSSYEQNTGNHTPPHY
ncbi:MAG: glycosyltransferase [Haliscomenobacter sp.]|uniref:glycosyltransferase n=1 Tax=Haliscomenobacter sp. TaxID=2717303 RepID=UPI0029BCCB58|nr:glycosyltransferase [Haliscomenobacter sp.]MDX2067808.1 glycosyltransferase [Haliscomenobacter sp.]